MKIPQFIHKANFTWQTLITWSTTSVLEWAGQAEAFHFQAFHCQVEGHPDLG